MSARSAGAQEHVANGLAWVAAQRAAGRSLEAGGGRARSLLAKELRKALSAYMLYQPRDRTGARDDAQEEEGSVKPGARNQYNAENK